MCTDAKCCTVDPPPKTCADINAAGGGAFDCSGHAKNIHASPAGITCADQSTGCTNTECCTVVPSKTCADINAAGGGAFDCSGDAKDINASPAGITCAAQNTGCTASECCTVTSSTTSDCSTSDTNQLTSACKCDSGASTNECVTNKYCWVDNTCNDAAKSGTKTCANRDGNGIGPHDCSSHANAIHASPATIQCGDQNTGCTDTECCTVSSGGTKTCADTDGAGGGVFDCGTHANDIHASPADITCDNTGCTDTKCCTVSTGAGGTTDCPTSDTVAVNAACKCDGGASTNECAMSKYCWTDNTCNDAAKVPTCTSPTQTNCKPAQCTAVDTPYAGCLPVCRTSCGKMPCSCRDASGHGDSNSNGCGQASPGSLDGGSFAAYDFQSNADETLTVIVDGNSVSITLGADFANVQAAAVGIVIAGAQISVYEGKLFIVSNS